jgi:hypothetical protein
MRHRYARTLSHDAKEYEKARTKYEEALSIVELVSGMTGADQGEIDMNKAACLMNIGAVCMAEMNYGEAVRGVSGPKRIFTRGRGKAWYLLTHAQVAISLYRSHTFSRIDLVCGRHLCLFVPQDLLRLSEFLGPTLTPVLLLISHRCKI